VFLFSIFSIVLYSSSLFLLLIDYGLSLLVIVFVCFVIYFYDENIYFTIHLFSYVVLLLLHFPLIFVVFNDAAESESNVGKLIRDIKSSSMDALKWL